MSSSYHVKSFHMKQNVSSSYPERTGLDLLFSSFCRGSCTRRPRVEFFLVLATLLYIVILATCEFWLLSLQINYSVFSRPRRSFGCFRTRGPGEAPTPFQHRSRRPHHYSHLLFNMTTSVSPLGWNHLSTN